jgi:hypothetical protein
MSQRSVEQIIGRLATDEEFRFRFEANRSGAIEEMIARGCVLSPVEQRALAELDMAACKRFARRIDSRLQKISLTRKP